MEMSYPQDVQLWGSIAGFCRSTRLLFPLLILLHILFLYNFITMQMKRKFRFGANKQSSSFVIAGLVAGAILAIGGSVLATTVGNSITVTSNLTVNGTAGFATTTAGSVVSIQGVGNFVNAATSTFYTPLTLSNLTATSSVLLATDTGLVGIGTTSPGSLLSIHGVGNFVNAATSTLYTDFSLRSISATSTIYSANGTALVPSYSFLSDVDTGLFRGAANVIGFATNGAEVARLDASGNLGIGSTTPGSLLALGTMANFVSNGTSTLANGLNVGNLRATSTVATTTISTGGFQVGQAGSLAAFTVGQSATTSVGVGTSTPSSHQFAVGGNALIGGGASGTTTLTVSSPGTRIGGCIELRATDGNMVRIYATTSVLASYNNNGLLALGGQGLVVEAGGCR